MKVRVCTRGELAAKKVKVFDVAGRSGLVFAADGAFYGCQRYCTHELFPLEFGQLKGHTLRCSYHGAEFDLRTGAVTQPPATKALVTYEVIVEGEDVFVQLPD